MGLKCRVWALGFRCRAIGQVECPNWLLDSGKKFGFHRLVASCTELRALRARV